MTGTPSRSTRPRVARSRPPTMRRSVVLPHPLGPSRHTNSPASTSKDTRSMTEMRKSLPTSSSRSFTRARAGALTPSGQAAGEPLEDEGVGGHHDHDHHDGPREDHLGGEDLAAVVHDVADAR